MRLLEKRIRARDVVTRKSLENAARVVACTGGSTNGGLHLPAIAHEAGIDFTLDDVCDIFHDTPYFVDLKPGGKYVAKDLVRRRRRAGGAEGTAPRRADPRGLHDRERAHASARSSTTSAARPTGR